MIELIHDLSLHDAGCHHQTRGAAHHAKRLLWNVACVCSHDTAPPSMQRTRMAVYMYLHRPSTMLDIATDVCAAMLRTTCARGKDARSRANTSRDRIIS